MKIPPCMYSTFTLLSTCHPERPSSCCCIYHFISGRKSWVTNFGAKFNRRQAHLYTNVTPPTLQVVSLCSWLDWKPNSIPSCTTGERRKQCGQEWLWSQVSTYQHCHYQVSLVCCIQTSWKCTSLQSLAPHSIEFFSERCYIHYVTVSYTHLTLPTKRIV